MSKILVDPEILKKATDYAAQAGPKLEKLAADETTLAGMIPAWAESMVTQGLLKKEAKAEFVAEIGNGGLTKVGELIELLLSNVGPTPMGETGTVKSAADVRTETGGRRASDLAFEQRLGL